MSGRYPIHTGITSIINLDETYGLPLNFTLMPQILKDNGYETHAVGKWYIVFPKKSFLCIFLMSEVHNYITKKKAFRVL